MGEVVTRTGLVERNLPLAFHFARERWSRRPVRGMDLSDLEQEAALAMVEAESRYRPDDGASFGTYAGACIKGQIKAVAARQHRMVSFGGRGASWVVRRALRRTGAGKGLAPEQVSAAIGQKRPFTYEECHRALGFVFGSEVYLPDLAEAMKRDQDDLLPDDSMADSTGFDGEAAARLDVEVLLREVERWVADGPRSNHASWEDVLRRRILARDESWEGQPTFAEIGAAHGVSRQTPLNAESDLLRQLRRRLEARGCVDGPRRAVEPDPWESSDSSLDGPAAGGPWSRAAWRLSRQSRARGRLPNCESEPCVVLAVPPYSRPLERPDVVASAEVALDLGCPGETLLAAVPRRLLAESLGRRWSRDAAAVARGCDEAAARGEVPFVLLTRGRPVVAKPGGAGR